jgi:hypothetical protein
MNKATIVYFKKTVATRHATVTRTQQIIDARTNKTFRTFFQIFVHFTFRQRAVQFRMYVVNVGVPSVFELLHI